MCNYKSGLKSLSQQCSLCFWTPQPNLIKFPLTPLNANIATLYFLVTPINQFLDRSQWQQESYHNTQTTNTQRWSKTRWDLIAAVCSLSNPGFPQISCAQKTQMQGSRGNPDQTRKSLKMVTQDTMEKQLLPQVGALYLGSHSAQPLHKKNQKTVILAICISKYKYTFSSG